MDESSVAEVVVPVVDDVMSSGPLVWVVSRVGCLVWVVVVRTVAKACAVAAEACVLLVPCVVGSGPQNVSAPAGVHRAATKVRAWASTSSAGMTRAETRSPARTLWTSSPVDFGSSSERR